jgi:hypothetical protein
MGNIKNSLKGEKEIAYLKLARNLILLKQIINIDYKY